MLRSHSRDRSTDAARCTAAETGTGVHAAMGDVSELDNMARLFAAAEAALGSVDILFKSQGNPMLGPTREVYERATIEQRTKDDNSRIPLTRPASATFQTPLGGTLSVGSRSETQPQDNRVLTRSPRNSNVGSAKTLAEALAADKVTMHVPGPGSILTDQTRQSNITKAKPGGAGGRDYGWAARR